MFEKIISRLGIKGTSKGDISGETAGTRENTVPVLGANNKIHSSMIDGTGLTIATIAASNVSVAVGTGNVEELAPTQTVQSVLEAILNPDTNLCLLTASNLSDVDDTTTAFTNIKQAATEGATGVVELATTAEVLAGSDAARVVTPAALSANYLKLTGGTVTGLIVNDVTPTLDTHVVNKGYVDDAVEGAILTKVNKTYWVDNMKGSASGVVGDSNKPYDTLAGAAAVASDGDLIIVRPGTYNENNLVGNSGVNWYFYPGAIIDYTGGGASPNSPIFGIGSTTTCNIYGYGVFKNSKTSGDYRYVIKAEGTLAKYNIQCQSIESKGCAILSDSLASGTIQIFDYIKSTDVGSISGVGAVALKLGSGNVQVNVGNEISAAATNGIGVKLGNGTMVAGATAIHTVITNKITAPSAAVYVDGSTNSSILCNTIYTTGFSAITSILGHATIIANRIEGDSSTTVINLNGGALTIKNALIYNQDSGNIPITYNAVYDVGTPNNPDYPYLVLNNCEVMTKESSLAVTSNNVNYKLRVMGYCQSDCVQPVAVTMTGGIWEHLETFPSNYPY